MSQPAEARTRPDLEIPGDVYQVLLAPAPLGGMPYPGAAFPWQALAAAGFRQVVCLANDLPDYDPRPLSLLYACEMEDLYGGASPSDPLRERRLVEESVGAIWQALQKEAGVIVHCQGGTGRTGTVLGAVLCRLGIEPGEVVAYLGRLNRMRGRPGWPESQWQADLLRAFHQ